MRQRKGLAIGRSLGEEVAGSLCRALKSGITGASRLRHLNLWRGFMASARISEGRMHALGALELRSLRRRDMAFGGQNLQRLAKG
jgi:hypothetical protein